MNVSWKKYPNNIGHMYYTGCFRCHDGQHKSDDGKVISRDCNLCHSIMAEGFANDMKVSDIDKPLEFEHPNDPDAMWKEANCVDCHSDLY